VEGYVAYEHEDTLVSWPREWFRVPLSVSKIWRHPWSITILLEFTYFVKYYLTLKA